MLVVVRYRNGRVVKGRTTDFRPDASSFHILEEGQDAPEHLPTDGLKAVFFVPLGDDIEELFTKQTRFTAGLGYVFDKAWTLEVRYAQLRMRDTIDADLRTTDHFIELRVKSSFRIVDLLKGR